MLKKQKELKMKKVELLRNKMKVQLLLLVLIVCPFSIKAQELGKIKEIIKDELILVNSIYGGRIFINDSKGIDTSNIRINSYDELDANKFFGDYKIVKINVTFLNLITQKSSVLMGDSTRFEYVLIERFGTYYNILGFSSSNINRVKVNENNDRKFKNFIHWTSSMLFQNNVLSKSESKQFYKSIIKNKLYYSSKINRPINIINQLFPNRLYQTTILDYSWIKPIIVHDEEP